MRGFSYQQVPRTTKGNKHFCARIATISKTPATAANGPGERQELVRSPRVIDDIPRTPLTDKLRAIWEVMQSLDGPRESFEEYYHRHCAGGTPNGRALASVLFYRALNYWPDYFRPTDAPAVAVWAELLDRYPLFTPDVIEAAVDAIHAAGEEHPVPAVVIRVARQMTEAI